MRYIKYLFPLLVFLVFACKKDPEPEVVAPETLAHGMLVLNEGLFQLNNSSLTWVDFNSGGTNSDFFTQKTGRLLGDTGNDMQRYGGKIYIVVNVSSTIEVLNAYTGAPITQISMLNGSTAKQPRSIAFYGNKAFISCFDGFVDVLDTATLQIIQRIPVGSNPDGITVSNQKLFVTNSGGLNTPVMDSTVSVIDGNSLTELTRIVVGKNPGSIATDFEGDVYVVTRGNYADIPSRLRRIDPNTLSLVETFPFDAGGIARMGDQLLISYYNFNNETNNVALFDAATETIVQNSFLDLSDVETLYGVHYRPADHRIYVLDAMGFTNTGWIRVFSTSGAYLQSYHVGLNPNSILFYE